MAIAEHAPEKLYERNRGVLSMEKEQMHDFASTKRKGLPMHANAKNFLRRNKRRKGVRHG